MPAEALPALACMLEPDGDCPVTREETIEGIRQIIQRNRRA